MRKKQCQWCGENYDSPHPSKLYCSDECKAKFGNFVTVVGKRIAPVALGWRIKRGGAGVGASAMKQLCALLDEANAEYRELRPKNAPNMADYLVARGKAPGVRAGLDRH